MKKGLQSFKLRKPFYNKYDILIRLTGLQKSR